MVGDGMIGHHGQHDQSSLTPHLTSPDFPILEVVSNTVLLWKIGCGQVCRLWCDEDFPLLSLYPRRYSHPTIAVSDPAPEPNDQQFVSLLATALIPLVLLVFSSIWPSDAGAGNTMGRRVMTRARISGSLHRPGDTWKTPAIWEKGLTTFRNRGGLGEIQTPGGSSSCPIPTKRRAEKVDVDCGGNWLCRADRCAKTQRRAGIVVRGMSAVWRHPAALTHQRPILSHGGACRP
jgi:hypothetical protein